MAGGRLHHIRSRLHGSRRDRRGWHVSPLTPSRLVCLAPVATDSCYLLRRAGQRVQLGLVVDVIPLPLGTAAPNLTGSRDYRGCQAQVDRLDGLGPFLAVQHHTPAPVQRPGADLAPAAIQKPAFFAAQTVDKDVSAHMQSARVSCRRRAADVTAGLSCRRGKVTRGRSPRDASSPCVASVVTAGRWCSSSLHGRCFARVRLGLFLLTRGLAGVLRIVLDPRLLPGGAPLLLVARGVTGDHLLLAPATLPGLVRLPLVACCLAFPDTLFQQLERLHGVRREFRLLLSLQGCYINLHGCRVIHCSFFRVVVNLVPLLVRIVGVLGCRLTSRLGQWGNIFNFNLLIFVLFHCQLLLLRLLSRRLLRRGGRGYRRRSGLRSNRLPTLSKRRQSPFDLGAQALHLLLRILTRGDLPQSLPPRWGQHRNRHETSPEKLELGLQRTLIHPDQHALVPAGSAGGELHEVGSHSCPEFTVTVVRSFQIRQERGGHHATDFILQNDLC
mmetsp:Transcript_19806/g.50312  ORF Transcript_19806/g.50312 Transcript_19806/m.50312 type:complete len:499 (-) Transcript_19806:36-1532(-)